MVEGAQHSSGLRWDQNELRERLYSEDSCIIALRSREVRLPRRVWQERKRALGRR